MLTQRCLIPVLLAIAPSGAAARTWSVVPDGSGDVATVQAGIDSAAAGDTVAVACGTYLEHDLVMKSDVVLRSETESASCVVIDAAGAGRGILCDNLSAGTEITGITFRNGSVTGGCLEDPGTGTYCMGGGMLCVGSDVRVRNCAFDANHAADSGGGVACLSSSPVFTDCAFTGNDSYVGGGLISSFAPGAPWLERCVLAGNSASADGGAVYGFDTDLTLSSCTLAGNFAGQSGGGAFWGGAGTLTVDRTIVAWSFRGEAFACNLGAAPPQLSCSNLYGNAGGDWTGCVAGQLGAADNASTDPLFCGGGFLLSATSPCAPGAGPCGLVGARGVGCGAVSAGAPALAPRSWGEVKSVYR